MKRKNKSKFCFLLSDFHFSLCFLLSALRFSFCFLLSAFMLLGISSCGNPTANPKGSLTGTVHLEDETNHSGITVALYDLAELDPDIVYANETWPFLANSKLKI